MSKKLKKSLLQGERRRPAGCVTHLAGHLFYPGRATRPRGADSMKKIHRLDTKDAKKSYWVERVFDRE
jgi:hypothetical protein